MARSLTLEKAQEWCNDPESSSLTHPNGENHNNYKTAWFDGYIKT